MNFYRCGFAAWISKGVYSIQHTNSCRNDNLLRARVCACLAAARGSPQTAATTIHVRGMGNPMGMTLIFHRCSIGPFCVRSTSSVQ